MTLEAELNATRIAPLSAAAWEAARQEPDRVLRSLRRGVLYSMVRVRRQLMVSGEWEDPSILPLDRAMAQLNAWDGLTTDSHVQRAMYEHSLRWTVRQVRKAQAARGDGHN